jgi:hypothetical protein
MPEDVGTDGTAHSELQRPNHHHGRVASPLARQISSENESHRRVERSRRRVSVGGTIFVSVGRHGEHDHKAPIVAPDHLDELIEKHPADAAASVSPVDRHPRHLGGGVEARNPGKEPEHGVRLDGNEATRGSNCLRTLPPSFLVREVVREACDYRVTGGRIGELERPNPHSITLTEQVR